jgi:hypothetical protein
MRRQQASVTKFSLAVVMVMFRAEQAEEQPESHKLHPLGMRRISVQIGSRIRNARWAGAGVCIIRLLGTWTMECCDSI